MSPTLQSEITAHTHEKWITSLHFVSQMPGTISAGRRCRSDTRYDKRTSHAHAQSRRTTTQTYTHAHPRKHTHSHARKRTHSHTPAHSHFHFLSRSLRGCTRGEEQLGNPRQHTQILVYVCVVFFKTKIEHCVAVQLKNALLW
jgi:hypothetical protein